MISTFIIPLIAGKGFLLFFFIALFASAVITNFFNNAVLIVIGIIICTPICQSMGIIPVIFTLMNSYFLQLAYLTPGASMPAALFFANTEWITLERRLLTDIAVMMLCMFVVIFALIPPYLLLF